MESISELRKRLQEEKVRPSGWTRPFGYTTFQRGPSIYITRVLLKTRLTPNHITFACIVSGIIGALFMLGLETPWKLLGIIFLYFNIILDKVDGELARHHNTFSLKGIYWDEINHLIIPPLFWIFSAYGILHISVFQQGLFMTTAALGAMALMVNRIVHSLAPQIYAKKYMKHPEHFPFSEKNMQDISLSPRHQFSFLRPIGHLIHQLQDFFIIISLSSLVLIFEYLFRRDYIFHPIFGWYIVGMSILFILFACENMLRKGALVTQHIEDINASHE